MVKTVSWGLCIRQAASFLSGHLSPSVPAVAASSHPLASIALSLPLRLSAVPTAEESVAVMCRQHTSSTACSSPLSSSLGGIGGSPLQISTTKVPRLVGRIDPAWPQHTIWYYTINFACQSCLMTAKCEMKIKLVHISLTKLL